MPALLAAVPAVLLQAASPAADATPTPLWRLMLDAALFGLSRHRPADHRVLLVGADHALQPAARDPREQNIAVAIVVAAFILGMAIIIAASLILIK